MPGVSGGPRARVAALATILLLAGCGADAPPQEAKPETLRIGLTGRPSSLDPHLQSENVAQSVSGNIYEALVGFDSDMRLQPQLAETWDNPSDRVWRFTLRPDVRFHDGRPLTIDHVIASLQRAMSHPESRQGGSLVAVSEIRRLDDRSLELVTSKPYPILLNRLAFIGIVPADAPQRIETPVGTGPYRFVSWDDDRIHLTAFDGHWGQDELIPKVEYVFISDGEDRARALIDGGIDLADEIPVASLPDLEQKPDLKIVSFAGLSVDYLHLDPSVPPFDDVRVREAVHWALARQGMVDALHSGHAEPAGQMVSQNVFGHHPELEASAQDVEKAKELLSAAGYPDGIDLELDVRQGRPVEPLLEALAQAGIRAKVVTRPWDETYSRLIERRASFYYGSWVCTSGDAGDSLDRKFHTRDAYLGYGDANHAGYSNPELDRLIETSNTVLDLKERQSLLQRALEMALLEVEPGDRFQQHARIGMLRIGKDFGRGTGFHDLAVLHHTDPVSNAPHDAQVMGDEQQTHVFRPLQLAQKLEDLRLDRHVERGGRLVRDQNVGPVGQRHGDHHALALPAGKLVRPGAQPAFGVADADLGQQFDDPLPRGIARQPLVQGEALGKLALDGVERVQRGHRLLEDEADVVAAHLSQHLVAGPDHLVGLVEH